MAKIVMWGISTTATEEQKLKLNELQNKYASFSLQTGNNKNQGVLADCLVLLKHDTDNLEDHKLNSVQWTVICTGNVTRPKLNVTNKTAGIPPTILIENLDNFLSATKTKTVIEKQEIEILFAIDPRLEKLLEPFASINPLEITNKHKGFLQEAKKELQTYVEKYLKEQNQP